MKCKFIIPKIALLSLLLAFLGQKFLVADNDLKQGQKEKVEIRDFSESADAQPAAQAPVAYSQTGEAPTIAETQDQTPAPAPEESGGVWAWIKENWAALILPLFALLEAIVRLTPTNVDNSILNFIKSLFDWILPNKAAKSGEYHK